MSEVDELIAWSMEPLPEALQQLQPQQQLEVLSWAKNLVGHETEGLDDLYKAIGMIVKYIPNFMVIPLMVEHIRPRIAAQVCIKMGIDLATGYANDLPLEYFSKISTHLDEKMMAQILTKMKRSQVEKFIIMALKEDPTRLLDIATHLERPVLEIVAKYVAFPEDESELAVSPHKAVIDKIRSLQ
ncbi:MAG: hypothetical protein FDX02_03280 [Chlorobium sp.]|nr:MAG: hypothetical protein FDX02_03280 [Chlorobium sp.]